MEKKKREREWIQCIDKVNGNFRSDILARQAGTMREQPRYSEYLSLTQFGFCAIILRMWDCEIS